MSTSENIAPTSPKGLAHWRVQQSPGKTIHLKPPEKVAQVIKQKDIMGDLVYQWKHIETGQRYFGSVKSTKKGNTVTRRLTTYQSKLKGPPSRRTDIEKALARSPTKFSFKIVEHKPGISEEELLAVEEAWQDRYGTRSPSRGYNRSRPTRERLRAGRNRRTAPKRTLFDTLGLNKPSKS
ncbi:MAG: hypothetical protein S4CHLAM2_11320 [Chlamydiales bacterium]|nr:hypothetical protein [Chlamydiales bacterium]